MKVSSIVLCEKVMLHGGVQRAARATGAPVSTVSDAVRKIEKALSVKLFIPSATGLILTAEGARLRPHLQAAAKEIIDVHGGLTPAITRPASLIALFRFADILQSGSIRKSARRLQVGQPQLTRMMAMLETSLGRQLIQRTRNGSRASAEGARIAPHVTRLRDIWAQLDSTSELRFRRHLRHWSLGAIPPATPDSPSAQILGRIAANWAKLFETPLYLQPALADSLLEGLEQQRYDAILIDMPVTNPKILGIEIQRSSLSFFAQLNSLERSGEEIPDHMLTAVRSQRLALPSRAAGLRQVAEAFLEQRLGPDWLSQVRLTEIDSIPVVVDLVMNHGYCSILPSTIAIRLPEIKAIPLPRDFRIVLQLAWRDDDRGTGMAEKVFRTLDPRLKRPVS
ncbi:LysR family transcriptional regulator [Paracoccus caeni]|uniref:LysR family transcriptional regulator n=1 Tax=Paracoccus caeni TaxID=657651 RepID=A0A934SMJ3_9RHOB|nr:LysR family transcriptional regulator [Paracoccus caeni]MBK4217957.1 LysR family transcriptional regulator [Paracoccus caeni]